MFGKEKEVVEQLKKLRRDYGLQGIKAEFEAEGSSLRDLVRLNRLTAQAGVGVFLKIGGVEAVRDIKDSLEVGVSGLIAPMAESTFGLKKFVDAYHKIYGDHRIHLSINVETRSAFEALDDILDYAQGKIDNITVGRSDLSGSYFDRDVFPDSDFILDTITTIGRKCKAHNLTMTVGGSISLRTISAMNRREELKSLIHRVETRKVIFPTDVFLASSDALYEALKFEELYILSKKEFSDLFISSEIARLTELQRRK